MKNTSKNIDIIPLSEPSFIGNEWKYVKECLDTGWVSSIGNFVNIFEEKICRYTKSKFAIACVNGSSALHVSLRILGVQPGDEVIVPTLTFIAPVNVVRYLNAQPVFMDCDDYYNIDSEKTIDFIKKCTVFKKGFTYNKKTKKRISAIIPVHVFGNAVNIEPLIFICRERNIKILEDASESLGSWYKNGKLYGRHTGTIGDIGCLSFNGNKIITTGGGGMILTNNEEYAIKAKYLTTQAKNDKLRFIHNDIGYNYRLTNIQAALGVGQLENLEKYLKAKKKNYLNLIKEIDKIRGIKISGTPEYSNNNLWLNILKYENSIFNYEVDFLVFKFLKKGIQTRPVWYLNHLQEPYKNCQTYNVQKSINMLNSSICLPSSANLKTVSINKIINSVKQIFKI